MLKNAVGLFIVAFVILIIFLPSYTKMQDLRARNRKFAQEIKELTAQKEELKEEERRLREDPDYLEKVAREEMGLIRKGEVIYRVTPAKNSQP